MNPILDYLKPNLDVIFIGFNPSVKSSETGYHYANPNNRFWKILFESGLTPRRFLPEENEKLLELGFGLTNIVSRPTKAADEITMEEYREGREELFKKLKHYQPKVACFVGKGVYQQFSEKKSVSWGFQDLSVLEHTKEFVAPSSSGLVRMKIDDIIEIYSELPLYLKTGRFAHKK
ncbi:G/U mismatch-specific DNA glycosylase [Cytobacillus horneckiae]|uniref:G/U mismatch-specific DNA glycosylase n=1 Tax=Cytobacillus horneckiae TaxID=549687 RepID=A0A2N0ZI58_9BACI|nr:G/U mismatch-specific DNA glycosylase [Cytobacillus horneckiae]MEC1158003.1 G/U mismatch-specific DNA glycosylase [Cytobacillus horneckiae]MED2937072.1 G/U mismatch-specific DNA glycosylase [Cytobacillus horneckiae]PKG29174.1 G/U mismatch-specific DNA glycosylase [Cytobacillus horneckiae]